MVSNILSHASELRLSPFWHPFHSTRCMFCFGTMQHQPICGPEISAGSVRLPPHECDDSCFNVTHSEHLTLCRGNLSSKTWSSATSEWPSTGSSRCTMENAMPQEELESTALPFRHKPTTMPQEERDNVVRPFRHRPPTKKSFPVHCNAAALLDPKTELIHRFNQLRELCKWPIPPEKHPMGVLLMKLGEEMQLNPHNLTPYLASALAC